MKAPFLIQKRGFWFVAQTKPTVVGVRRTSFHPARQNDWSYLSWQDEILPYTNAVAPMC